MYRVLNITTPANFYGALLTPLLLLASCRCRWRCCWRCCRAAAAATAIASLLCTPTTAGTLTHGYFSSPCCPRLPTGWYGNDYNSRYANRRAHKARVAAGEQFDAWANLENVGGLMLDSIFEVRR